MKKLIIYLLIAISIYGSEVDFTKGRNGQLLLLPRGEIRVRENFVPDQPGKKVVINNLNNDVEMDSIVVEGSDIYELTIQNQSDNGTLKGIIGEYKGENYRLISTSPLTIENLNSGDMIINPLGELKFKSLNKKNEISATLLGKKDISEIALNYDLAGLNWEMEYSLYLNKNEVRKEFLIKNNSKKNFENILVVFSNVNEVNDFGRFDLKSFMEIKKNVFTEKRKIIKNYIYSESKSGKHPELTLEVEGVDIETFDKIKIFDENGYLGDFKIIDKNGEFHIGGILEDKIHVEHSESEKSLGIRLKQRKIKYVIKNYKKEAAFIKVIYDKLPEKWNELRSDRDYEVVNKKAVFILKLPANSREEINFSFIEEKN
jgi:hypothetical protein